MPRRCLYCYPAPFLKTTVLLLILLAPLGASAQAGTEIATLLAQGEAALDARNFSDASRAFKAVLAQAPDNLAAHYGLGVATRERAGYSTPLRLPIQLIDWAEAEKHFDAVLAQDSLFRDILWQRALLAAYRYRHRAAIAFGQAQRRLKPGLPGLDYDLLQHYRAYWAHDLHEAQAWFVDRPDDVFARLALLDGLRQHRFDEREALPPALLAALHQLRATTEWLAPAIHLSLARAYYQHDEPAQVEEQFWAAVAAIHNATDAQFVFEDVKYLLNTAELAEYESLQTVAEQQAFFHRFWRKRDPLPAAEGNVRLVEHYRRLLVATREFRRTGSTWQNTATFFSEWDAHPVYQLNQAFNDKGYVFVRYGEPDDRITYAAAGPPVGETREDFMRNRRAEPAPRNESWRYYETPNTPELVFHFIIPPESSNQWQLTKFYEDRRLTLARAPWDGRYHEFAHNPNNSTVRYELEEQIVGSAVRMLETDRHRWSNSLEPLPLAIQFFATRATDGLNRIDVYYAVPLDPLRDATGADRLPLEAGLAVDDPQWQSVFQDRSLRRLRLGPEEGTHRLGVFTFTAPPDTYYVALHAQPRDTDLLGGVRFTATVDDFSTPDLHLTNLLLATHIAPTEEDGLWVRDGLDVRPNPTRRYRADAPIFVYFEAYHLTFDPDLRTRYRLDYTLTRQQRRRLLGGRSEPAWSLEATQSGTDGRVTEYLEIDAGAVPPGRYLLEVRVTDLLTGRTRTRAEELTLEE